MAETFGDLTAAWGREAHRYSSKGTDEPHTAELMDV